jgi:chromosome segregation ATPase
VDTTIAAIFAGAVVALITGLFGWKIAKRTNSGKVDTTTAETLWTEGTNMRVELRAEVADLKKQLVDAATAISELTKEIRQSRSETEDARKEIRLLVQQISNVHDEVKTSNALTIGALMDNQETRRILEIPKGERSDAENEHVATASDRMPEANLPDIPVADQEMPHE